MNSTLSATLQSAARRVSPSAWEERVRNVTDVLVSGLALIALGPVLLLVAVVTRLDSPGPILFRQERIGRNRRQAESGMRRDGEDRRRRDLPGRPFTFYKFRTMYADSRTRFPHLYDYKHSRDDLRTVPIKVLMCKRGPTSSPKQAVEEDPRVTRVGRWLRRTSLDELPNLFNVLKGDMHLVGPRPDIAENIAFYDPHELRILDVKPGVTGLAQVKGRGFLSFEETNALDLEYLNVRSLWVDARILIRTFLELVKARGAY